MQTYDFYLWKFAKDDGKFSFIHESELPEAGFSSLYGVSEEDARKLEAAGSYAGFRGKVWSDKLWIDTDSLEQSEAVESKLRALGLAYDKYFSGSRGHHYGIPRNAEPSEILPLLDKQWCEENLGTSADLKLYSHLHLFRRPGARHEKTGKLKERIYTNPVCGEVLDFTNYALKPTAPRPSTAALAAAAAGSIFEDMEIMNLTVPYSDGNRTKMFLVLAQRLADRGESYEFALGWMDNVNRLGEPLPAKKIEDITYWAYFTRTNGRRQEEVA